LPIDRREDWAKGCEKPRDKNKREVTGLKKTPTPEGPPLPEIGGEKKKIKEKNLRKRAEEGRGK